MCDKFPGRMCRRCPHCGGKPQVYIMCTEHPTYRRYDCGPCGKGRCRHGKLKQYCAECDGGSICEHKIERRRCPDCDPAGHLVYRMRIRMYHALRGKSKTQRTMEYVGCTAAFLRERLDELCDFYNATTKYPGFVFDKVKKNYDVDHFLPLNPVDEITDEERNKRFHWTNLRPMPHVNNIEKGNRIEEGPSPDEERESARKLLVEQSVH
jgi:hypothetical protein